MAVEEILLAAAHGGQHGVAVRSDETGLRDLQQRGIDGAYAEYLLADAGSLCHIPAGRSLAEARTLPMNGRTAVRALDKLCRPTRLRKRTGGWQREAYADDSSPSF